jgi:phosphatidylinositol-3-phosphatase
MRRVAGRPGALTTAVLAAAVLVLTACTGTTAPATAPPTSPSTSASTSASTSTPSTGPASGPGPTASVIAGTTGATGPRRKVLVVAEENHTAEDVLGSGRAPYLSALARRFATLTDMAAGYPVGCPSLPAYLLMTSGSTHDVCDDAGPAAHPIDGASIFSQVEDAGLQWRGYAESMPAPCTRDDAAVGRYLVRHAPAPYYTGATRCRDWDLPLGTASAGALHDDVTAGSLPDYGFVTPNACDDMHGANVCGGDVIADGDRWLAGWLPQIMAGPDYREGRLVIVVTWDEGSRSSNHIPTVVVSPTAQGVQVTERVTHCGLLAMEEDLLRLPRLGCATSAPSPGPALGLA